MSILASLVNAYDRMGLSGGVPTFGFARTEVDFCIVLKADGRPAFDPIDFRQAKGKRQVGRQSDVPTPLVQRTSGIAPNFLWDKTAYSLGVGEEQPQWTPKEHQAFVEYHRKVLANVNDAGASTFLNFLEWWEPQKFDGLGWPIDMKDANIVFALDVEYRIRLLHEREALKRRWLSLYTAESATIAACLLTGSVDRIARSHPPIKGVRKTQSSGAFIVSYNATAFTSYNHKEGDNAPISELSAFKYTTALSTFLKSDSNRVQIGDASTVFWADATDASVAIEAEGIFGRLFGVDEEIENKQIADKLKLIVEGVSLEEIEPKLSRGVRFYVVGLSPNMARISIRFWFEDDFGVLTENYQRYVSDMRFVPWPQNRPPATIRSLVMRTAPARRDRSNKVKFNTDQISSLLSGELFRAILTGARFPGSLLPTLIMRIRADHLLDSARVSLIKAIIVRTMRIEGRLPNDHHGRPQEDYLVRSNPADPNPARRLGRLFALIERAQLAALGDDINTTVKDKYLGAAAATPEQVFSKLVLNAEQHHIKRLRNGHSGAEWIKDAEHAQKVGFALGQDIGRLWATFNDGLPAQHSNEEQGLFLVGYYQERFGKRADEDGGMSDDEEITSDEQE